MGQLDYIAVIEIGSEKLRGIVGKKNSDESIQVLSYAFENSSTFIKKGVVFNIDKTAQALTNIINKLEGNLDKGITISKVYVGFGGKSLRTEKNSVMRNFGEDIKISQEIIESIIEESRQTRYMNKEILVTIPQNYKLGTNLVSEPVGISTKQIEGHFLNLIADTVIRERIMECFSIANIEIAEMVVSPLALADHVLSDTDKRAGCVLVDFGYDTTVVSIYKNKILRNLTVLPIGGNNITQDIASVLKIEAADAEQLKIVYGSAFNNPSKDKDYMDEKISINGLDRDIERPLFDDIVVARTEEIIENVINIIKKSGYDSQLFSGIIITGGGSQLRGIADLLEDRCKDMKVKVVKNNWNLIPSPYNAPLEKPNENDSLLSLFCSGTVSCCSQQADQTVIVDGKLFTDADNEPEEKAEEIKEEVEKVSKPKKEKVSEDKKEEPKTKDQKNNKFISFLGRLFGEGDPSWNEENEKQDEK